jgi:hypothetical protein
MTTNHENIAVYHRYFYSDSFLSSYALNVEPIQIFPFNHEGIKRELFF